MIFGNIILSIFWLGMYCIYAFEWSIIFVIWFDLLRCIWSRRLKTHEIKKWFIYWLLKEMLYIDRHASGNNLLAKIKKWRLNSKLCLRSRCLKVVYLTCYLFIELWFNFFYRYLCQIFTYSLSDTIWLGIDLCIYAWMCFYDETFKTREIKVAHIW